MALLLLLLLLTLRPSLRPAQELSLRSVVSDNFDMAKAGGPGPGSPTWACDKDTVPWGLSLLSSCDSSMGGRGVPGRARGSPGGRGVPGRVRGPREGAASLVGALRSGAWPPGRPRKPRLPTQQSVVRRCPGSGTLAPWPRTT